jgi:uncharacterized lipoprotein
MSKNSALAIVLASLAVLSLSACDVKKTKDGDLTLPKVEINKTQEGNVTLPKYEVTPPDVNVSTTQKTVTVPTLTTEEKTVTVPKVTVTPAK